MESDIRNRSIKDVAAAAGDLRHVDVAIVDECKEASLCDVYRYLLVGFGGGGTLYPPRPMAAGLGMF